MSEAWKADLHPYIWWPSPDADYATLVFARNRREAKVVGFHGDPGGHTEYIHCRVNRLPRMAHLVRQMEKKEAHVIESPLGCEDCGCWSDTPECNCKEEE